MKRYMIFLLLFSIIFISACAKETVIQESSFCKTPYFEYKVGECCLDQNSNSVCDNDEIENAEETQEEAVEEIVIEEEPEIAPSKLVNSATFDLAEGETATFNNIDIKLITLDLGANLNAVFEVGGKRTTIFSTKTQDIVGDISISIDSITGYGDDEGILVNVEKFQLEQDNYIVRAGDVLSMGGKKISITQITRDTKTNVIQISIDKQFKERIVEGATKTYGKVKITNKKVFFKGNNVDNYAIIEIKVG